MSKLAKNKYKIAVAMSGGVDSSVAAKLLKDLGHEVAGFFLHFWKEPNASADGKCCSSDAMLSARRAADKIGLPLYTLNLAEMFKRLVVDDFLAEYAAGRTPNPCVRCNKTVKLGYLLAQTKKLGFDFLASGHYARLKREIHNPKSQIPKKITKNACKLYKAKDVNKDQSYFLYTLNQAELKRLLFPLGGLTKPEVRRLALKFGLPTAKNKDSQDVCFIAGNSHNDFLRRHLELKPGPIKLLCPLDKGGKGVVQQTEKNKITPAPFIKEEASIGTHQGLPLYTIGQRKGINIGGSGPYYAAKMDYEKNILYVVDSRGQSCLRRSEFIAANVNWLSGRAPETLNCQAAIRYRHPAAACQLKKISDSVYSVKFNKPQTAITPGQSAVFYRGREVLGGGVIK